MILDNKKRCLEKLSYRYHLKNKSRSSLENWVLAEKLLKKLEKRYNVKNK